MKNKLVSIIIPCYNGEKTINRCLDSILQQTWDNIETIIIDDGSTDNSEKIIKSYINKFNLRGYKLTYIHQCNQGLGGAINTGIKNFTGDYLCWIDVDDFLFPESIKIKAEYLESHNDIVGVTTDAFIYNETNLNEPIGKISDNNSNLEDPDQFKNIILQKAIICQGCQMLRSDAFIRSNPTRSIYPSRNGQNIQMLLPTLYNQKHAYIPLQLYGYVVYNNSMLHRKKNYYQQIETEREYYKIIAETLKKIDMPINEIIWCKIKVKQKMNRNLLYIHIEHKNIKKIIVTILNMIFLGEFKKKDCKLIINYLLKLVKNGE